MRGAGAWREGSWRAAEKALLGENDRPVPETPLYTKHLKDWTSFITGQHESCSTHISNWPLSLSLSLSVSHSLPQHSLLFKLEDRQERGMERGREQSKEEQKRLQRCLGPSLFTSGLTNRRGGGERGGGERGGEERRQQGRRGV